MDPNNNIPKTCFFPCAFSTWKENNHTIFGPIICLIQRRTEMHCFLCGDQRTFPCFFWFPAYAAIGTNKTRVQWQCCLRFNSTFTLCFQLTVFVFWKSFWAQMRHRLSRVSCCHGCNIDCLSLEGKVCQRCKISFLRIMCWIGIVSHEFHQTQSIKGLFCINLYYSRIPVSHLQ